jgi:hypothetical protein
MKMEKQEIKINIVAQWFQARIPHGGEIVCFDAATYDEAEAASCALLGYDRDDVAIEWTPPGLAHVSDSHPPHWRDQLSDRAA